MNSSASCCLLVLKSDLNLAKNCFKGFVDFKDEWSVFFKFVKKRQVSQWCCFMFDVICSEDSKALVAELQKHKFAGYGFSNRIPLK